MLHLEPHLGTISKMASPAPLYHSSSSQSSDSSGLLSAAVIPHCSSYVGRCSSQLPVPRELLKVAFSTIVKTNHVALHTPTDLYGSTAALLRYSSHTTHFNHLRCPMQCSLVNSLQNCLLNSKTLSLPIKNSTLEQ